MANKKIENENSDIEVYDEDDEERARAQAIDKIIKDFEKKGKKIKSSIKMNFLISFQNLI